MSLRSMSCRTMVSQLMAAAVFMSPVTALAKVHTPAKGSVERQALMDAMRAKGDDQDRVFVVKFLKVDGEWAWLDAEPQSRDGRNHYEPESALFQRKAGKWRVVAQPCGEADCDYDQEVVRIRAEFEGAPDRIFP